jgi:hypothetical protein
VFDKYYAPEDGTELRQEEADCDEALEDEDTNDLCVSLSRAHSGH